MSHYRKLDLIILPRTNLGIFYNKFLKDEQDFIKESLRDIMNDISHERYVHKNYRLIDVETKTKKKYRFDLIGWLCSITEDYDHFEKKWWTKTSHKYDYKRRNAYTTDNSLILKSDKEGLDSALKKNIYSVDTSYFWGRFNNYGNERKISDIFGNYIPDKGNFIFEERMVYINLITNFNEYYPTDISRENEKNAYKLFLEHKFKELSNKDYDKKLYKKLHKRHKHSLMSGILFSHFRTVLNGYLRKNIQEYKINNNIRYETNKYEFINIVYGGKRRKTKKVRKHRAIIQTGGNAGRLKKGYRYSGKKLKSGLPQIIKCKSKKR